MDRLGAAGLLGSAGPELEAVKIRWRIARGSRPIAAADHMAGKGSQRKGASRLAEMPHAPKRHTLHTFLTFLACGPRSVSSISKLTRSPSARVLNPEASMEE